LRLPATSQARVNAALEPCSSPRPELSRLYAAMRYSVMNGGKRVRPLLAYAACEALGGKAEQANGAACAVELIHAYSLVHDDLPAMDDDDLRRGQPTTHKKFDEACAILAGDGLQSLAFSALLDPRLSSRMPTSACNMVRPWPGCRPGGHGRRPGHRPRLGGPEARSASAGIHAPAQDRRADRSQRRLGALASGRAEQDELKALQTYAQAIGLAFQVQDDILDVESDTATLGKRQGADIARDKPTYPALLGLDAAKAYALELRDQALHALRPFDAAAEPCATWPGISSNAATDGESAKKTNAWAGGDASGKLPHLLYL
jgi:geranylgeranyl diphosphate synthase type II